MKKIAVVFGGASSEYEVSLQSAYSVLETLEKMEVEILKIGITEDADWYLFDGNNQQIQENSWFTSLNCTRVVPDMNKRGFFLIEKNDWIEVEVVFPVLHGNFGEDGKIQGVFEMMGVPYVGCKEQASSVCMNKALLHKIAESIGIQVTPTLIISTNDFFKAELLTFISEVGYPVFVKPNRGGSSIGINKVQNESELYFALKEASKYDSEIVVEQAVQGIEVGCGVLGNEDLVIGTLDHIDLVDGFFDYTEKYQLITAKITLPASVSEKISSEIKRQAAELYLYLGCKGLSRIDFFVTDKDEILLNEVNTLPGFTDHSRFPSMMKSIDISYQELLERLIVLAEQC